MILISEIISAENLKITCKTTDGKIHIVDVAPLLEKHKHFHGIEKLQFPNFFKTVKVGEMGELFWENCICIDGELWNYDISPEFVIHNSTILESAND